MSRRATPLAPLVLTLLAFAGGAPLAPAPAGAENYGGTPSPGAGGLSEEEERLHQRLLSQADKGEAMDEPLAGETLKGTPVYPRTPNYFPAEARDLFWQMDKVRPRYELRLLPDTPVDGIPREGRSLVVVSESDNGLHFRIFDPMGKTIADGAEGDVPSGEKGEQLGRLKALLGQPLPATEDLEPIGRAGAIQLTTSLFGHHPDRELVPLDFDVNRDGKIDEVERNAIRGRNTWLLWGGGNEAFWGWLQEDGYGFVDFIILADSRERGTRFARTGLINQPGFRANSDPEDPLVKLLGLYVDRPQMDGDRNLALLLPPGSENPKPPGGGGYYPEETIDAYGREVDPPAEIPALPDEANPDRDLFEPGDRELYEAVRKAMPRDGLDYSVYGYPSGIFGLRYMLNPDFFGNTKAAARARDYWQERVVKTGGRYYESDAEVSADPKLVRPLRMSMSCGFCHVAPHPLLPPDDPEAPKWENLSSIIGNQYWLPQPAFANRATKSNFLHHVLRSQPPGTIDTSLVSTDHLNNTNVINAIFDVPARLARAETKPPEIQSGANLLFLGKKETDPPAPLQCPMVLFPGEDSVGVLPALARVPLNIGTFSEQWGNVDNPIIGFRPQRPFSVATCRTNSVHWMVNETRRVPYMADFFTLGTEPKEGGQPPVPKSTQAMKLKSAPDAGRFLDPPPKVDAGREVFLNNCAICHSGKQPAGFDLRFAREMEGGWSRSPKPGDGEAPVYTLPMDYLDWEEFRKSPALRDYRKRIRRLAGDPPPVGVEDPFLDGNFLSNELRVPVTLVGTNAARALATNAMDGNVWDNYSSRTFKNMGSVGPIRYYNLFSNVAPDRYGTNAEFTDGRESGGPGYMRPPSLISLWATAPYFHNNALGLYNHDPGVAARMEAFDDGIRKILYDDLRRTYTQSEYLNAGDKVYVADGDLRHGGSPAAEGDPGYIYRLPQDVDIQFAAGYIPQLIRGIVGDPIFSILSFWIWVALVLLLLWVACRGGARHAGIVFLLLAVMTGGLLALTGLGSGGGTVGGALVMTSSNMLGMASRWLWLVPLALAAVGLWLSLTRHLLRRPVQIAFLALALVTACAGILANKYLNGRLRDTNLIVALLPNSWTAGAYKGIKVGPVPKGTPVDLMMNLDPEKKDKLPQALVGLARANLTIKKKGLKGEEAYRVFAAEAGPALLEASKCPDLVLDRGHWFGEELSGEDKENLIAFLKTL